MRIALCDDVYYEVEDIEKYLVANGEEVDFFDHGDALLEAYEQQHQRYDAVFLDLEMKSEKEGFQIADALKSIDDTVLIVFATSHRQYVYESFRCSPVWFLCKPIEKDDLEKAHHHLQFLLSQRRQTFTFRNSHQSVRLRCDEILYFEAQDHDIIVHKKDGTSQSFRLTMKELEEQLSENFCRVHASYIVNMQYVTRIVRENENSRQEVVTLEHSSQPIPVSRKYKSLLNDAFLNFKEKEFIG